MKEFFIYSTQPERRNVFIEGVCKRSDGMYHVLTEDGKIQTSTTSDVSKMGAIWNFKLTTMATVEREPDGMKRAQAVVYVPDSMDIENMNTSDERVKGRKMINLIEYWKLHPMVAHMEYKEGGLQQVNPNFLTKRNMGVYFVLIDRSSIQDYEFQQNRVKKKALAQLDQVFDECLSSRDYQKLHDLCYGLNVSISPYKTPPKENYNKLEDFINRSPDKFISFVERKSEARLIVLFKKAHYGVTADKEPLITFKNDSFYFGDEILGKTQEDVVFFLSKNQKVADFLEDALNIKRPAIELDIVEKKLEKEIEAVVAIGHPQDEDKHKSESNQLDQELEVVEKVNKRATELTNKLRHAKSNQERFADLVVTIKDEFESYKPENKPVFAEVFNAMCEKKNINFKLTS